MSMEYCHHCDSTFDSDEDAEHYEECPDYRDSKYWDYIDNQIDTTRGK